MNNNFFRTALTAVIIVALIWVGFSSWRSNKPNTSGSRQAVFLADGQVFFGYASSLRNQTVTLKEVYYLQKTSPETQPSSTTTAADQINLIKLGDELYGPKDVMIINRDRITYISDMKDDAQINQKISDYLKKKAEEKK